MSENLKKALKTCRKHVRELKLQMNILDVSYDSKNRRLLFTYEAEKRVDFRELLHLLQNDLKVKIELRQVGPRDTAKQLGGIGPCGMECCCKRYMKNFRSVTIKMLKAQKIQGNPQKYTGVCGKLRCCLAFEYCPHGKDNKSKCAACIKLNKVTKPISK